MQTYEILSGVGQLYIAPVGTAFPGVTETPGVAWEPTGETQDGVTITVSQTVVEIRSDQATGPKKAIRSEEGFKIATNLLEATLEKLAKIFEQSVTDTPPGSGTIGHRAIGLYRGSAVQTYALLFRGEKMSPYGETYPGQFEVPVGYFGGDQGLAFKKDAATVIPVEFSALEDPNAATEGARFGALRVQDAAALP